MHLTAQRRCAVVAASVIGMIALLALPSTAFASPTATLTGYVSKYQAPGLTLANTRIDVHRDVYGTLLASTTTDAAGNFSISGLAPGRVRIHFVDLDGNNAQRWFTGGGTSTATSFATAASVGGLDPGATLNISTFIPRNPQWFGKAEGPAAQPLEGIEVTLRNTTFGTVAATTTTAAGGYFTFANLSDSATYSLTLVDPTHTYATRYYPANGPSPGQLLTAGGTNYVILSMSLPATITGTVTDARGAPLAGMLVGSSPMDKLHIDANTTTNASGGFQLSGLHPVPHGVLVIDPAFLSSSTGYWPTLNGNIPINSLAMLSQAIPLILTAATTTDAGTIHLSTVNCDIATIRVGAYLPGADLDGANLSGCYFPQSNLAGASLQSASLQSSDLSYSSLENADLDGADFTGATLEHASLTGATTVGAIWSNTICPDGTNSNANAGTCAGHLGTSLTTAVTRTDDAVDTAPGDGVCLATGGGCTLRAAIQEANAWPGPATIDLASGATYTLSRAGANEDADVTGDLDVTSGSLDLIGHGSTITTTTADRILDIAPGAYVNVSNVTITGGHAPDGANGVGTYAAGAAGQDGGGVRNRGTTTLSLSTVTANRAGGGGQAPTFGAGGAGGVGGGIANTGTLTVDRSTVSSNESGVGGLGFNGGAGGRGAGISSSGTLVVTASTISGNRTGDGAPGYPGVVANPHGGHGAAGGDGGGIAATSGLLTISNSTISTNDTGWGGDGGDGSNADFFTITYGGNGGNGGDGGRGGGVFAQSATVTLHGTTVTKNSHGYGGAAGTGGQSYGAGPPGTNGTPGTTPAGTGIARASGTVTVSASIVASQTTGADCEGAVVSAGYNLESSTSCAFTATGDQQSTNPLIWVLAANGGPTKTHLALSTAPRNKIPAGTLGCGTTWSTDQRGVARPTNALCDIGAVEL